MHFLPTEEQSQLQCGIREVLDAAAPLERAAEGFRAELWETVDRLGVFSLRRETEHGLATACLVFEELGRAAVAGPLAPTFLTDGTAPAGPVAVLERDNSPPLAAHLDVATSLLVLDRDRAWLCPVDELEWDPVPDPLDPLTPLGEVTRTPQHGPLHDSAPHDAGTLRRDGAVLTAALQVGLADRLTSLATAYAKTREQFGRPIGSFQAVKHLCADMLVRTELARVAVHAAAVAVDQPGVTDTTRAVAGAKLLADEAATSNARSCVQVHGGMGFTWELPIHYLVKRTWFLATEFGSADAHAEALAGRLG